MTLNEELKLREVLKNLKALNKEVSSEKDNYYDHTPHYFIDEVVSEIQKIEKGIEDLL